VRAKGKKSFSAFENRDKARKVGAREQEAMKMEVRQR
jgi:hypothetical protein